MSSKSAESLLKSSNLEDVALVTEQKHKVTYRQLRENIAQTAEMLEYRSLIFVVGRNDYIPILFYLSALEHSHVVLMLPIELTQHELSRLFFLYQPRYLLLHCESSLLPGASMKEAWISTQPILNKIDDPQSVLSECDANSAHGTYQLWHNASTQPDLHPDLAVLMATSGSTGDPKLARLSKKNLFSNADSIAHYLELDRDERALLHLPVSYSFGLSILNSHLFSGGSVVLTNDSVMSRGFWSSIKNEGVTSFAGVPYHFEMLHKLKLERLDFGLIRTMTHAGGALAPDVLEKMLAFSAAKGWRFYSMYGQTEASPRISYVPPSASFSKVGSIGIAIPGGRLWIRDEIGRDITVSGQTGELVYQGPNVCLGYADCAADLSVGDQNNEVLATGDLAKCDQDGYFFLKGRLKRFLKIFGQRISLDQVEAQLMRKGFSAVASGSDDLLTIYVEGVSQEQASSIMLEVSQQCGVHISAVLIKMIQIIPRMANGKVNYKCLGP